MANRYVAGAAGLPFAVLRGYNGPASSAQTATIKPITCPFTGERLTAVAALNPDVAIIHAQQADRAGNVQFWGIAGVQKEAVLAARRSLVTVEEIVDSLDPRPGAVVLPSWAVDLRGACARRRASVLRAGYPSATTTTTSPGTRSRGTGRRSAAGWTENVLRRGGPA